jgi:chaperonin GroES
MANSLTRDSEFSLRPSEMIIMMITKAINFMKIKPLNDNIVVKPTKENEITKSGIVLPETIDKERPEKGEIIAIGEGKLLDNGQRAPMSVKVGDKVMFKKYSPDEIKVDDQEYLILSQNDILAIIE